MGIQTKRILKNKEEQQPEQESAKPSVSMAQEEASNNANVIGAALGVPKRNPPNNQTRVPSDTMEDRQRPKPMPYRPPSLADRNRVGPVSPVLGVGSPIKRPGGEAPSMAQDNRRMYKNRRPEIRDPRQLEQMQEYMPENQPSPMAEEYGRMYKNRTPEMMFNDGGLATQRFQDGGKPQKLNPLSNIFNVEKANADLELAKKGVQTPSMKVHGYNTDSEPTNENPFENQEESEEQPRKFKFKARPEERPIKFSEGEDLNSFDVGKGVDMGSNDDVMQSRKKAIMNLLKGGM